MTINILPLRVAEIGAASDLIETIFGKFGDRAKDEFARLFRNESHPTYVFLAHQDNKPVGIGACLETYFAMNVFGICWVGVLLEYRDRGICTALLHHIEDFITNELLEDNTGTIILAADNAANLYERLGYTKQHSPIHDESFIMSKIIKK